jgi:hypothetical protein
MSSFVLYLGTNRELLGGGEAAGSNGWGVAFDGFDNGAVEVGAESFVVGAAEVGAEVFAFAAVCEIPAEEALDGLGAVFGGGAVADLAGDVGVLAYGPADAEVEGVDHLAVLLDLLAFEADVGDPALTAGVGAAGDVKSNLLVEAGKALLEIGDEPLVEGLGLGDGELAELGAGAGDGSAEECGGVDVQAEGVELDDEAGNLVVRDVGDENVLADGGAEVAVTVFVGEVGEGDELIAGETAVEDRSADGGEAGLALWGDSHVVAVDVAGGGIFGDGRGVQLIAELFFDGGEHRLGGPAVLHEEVLDAGAGAVLAEFGLLFEDADDCGDDVEGLVLRDEGGDALGEVGLGGETAADAEGVADLFLAGIESVNSAWFVSLDGGEADVVNLGEGAPDGASGDGDLELAGEVVELGVGGEEMRDLHGEWAGVQEFLVLNAGERAAGDVADYVAAGALGGEVDLGEGVDGLDEGVDGEPVELDVLAGGDVGQVAGVFAGELAYDAGLMGGEQAVGHADAHHEVLGGLAFAADAAGDTQAVALGVDAPPLEVEIGPLRGNGVASDLGVGANLVPGFPGIFGELEALTALGFGLFRCGGDVGHGLEGPFGMKLK